MSAIGKAEAFILVAKENGWKGQKEFDYDDDYAKLSLHRENERLEIEWHNNQLTGPPSYSFSGVPTRLHCASVAKRTLQRTPEVARRQESQVKRRKKQKPLELTTSSTHGDLPEVYSALPFTIGETDDREILKLCRNRTIVWRSQFSDGENSAFVPKLKNLDTTNVYYIGESSEGRPYLSFIDELGCFRAVAFDAMLRLA